MHNDTQKKSTKSLPPWEIEVAKRLGRIRKSEGLTQAALGQKIGTNRYTIANIESCRTTLSFNLGWEICKSMNLSQWWLASGNGLERPFIDVPDDHLRKFDASQLSFCDACLTFLNDHLEARSLATISFLSEGAIDRVVYQKYGAMIRSFCELSASMVEHEYRFDYLKHLIDFAKPYLEKMQEQRDAYIIKNSLIIISELLNTTSMPTKDAQLWPHLRERLAKATVERGKQAWLARHLRVSPQALSQWLSGASAPDAENTLQLLTWVAQEETKRKSSGGVTAPPEQRTQRKANRNESKSSDPRKRK